MRKTLHEYIIAKEAECATPAGINVKKFFKDVIKYAKLTNRQPSLGDFVGENAIFKGDWEVFHDNEWSCLIKKDEIILNWTKEKNYLSDNLGNKINSIEDLPLEIEFKEGVI
jgi:hypothetical protein